MAEPALNYDPDDEKPVTKPNLRALEEGKEQAAVHSKADPSAATSNLTSAPSKALKKAEQAWGTAGIVGGSAAAGTKDQIGGGFNPNDSAGGLGQKIKGTISDPGFKKKAFFGGGIAGGAVAGFTGLLLILIPLKVAEIVTDLENHFFSGADGAVEHEEQNLLDNYLERYVMPGLKVCGSTVNKDCTVNIRGDNPVENLYKAWHNARLENRLADDYGIELEYVKLTPQTGTYKLTSPRDPNEDIDLGADGSGLTTEFDNVTAFREAAYTAMEAQTKWYEVLTRFKFRRLLQEKYDTPSCLIFCGIKDDLRNAIKVPKTAANQFLSKYVLQPLSDSDGVIAMCVFNPECSPEDLKPTTNGTDADNNDVAETNGAPESQVEADVRSAVESDIGSIAADEAAAGAGEAGEEAAATALEDTYNDIQANGLAKYIASAVVEKLVTALLGETAGTAAGDFTGDAIPYVGEINMAAQLVSIGSTAGKKIRDLQYLVEAAAAVRIYMEYRTYADETKTGNVDATEVGSFTDALGPTPASTNAAGGTAGAEQTPLYQDLIDGNSSGKGGNTYTCKDGSTPDSSADPGEICNEEKFGTGNSVLNDIGAFFNIGCPSTNIVKDLESAAIGTATGGLTPCALKDAANIWNSTIGQIFNFIGEALGGLISLANHIPCGGIGGAIAGFLTGGGSTIYCTGKAVAADLGKYIIQVFVSYFIPTPFSNNMSGGRTFDMMAAGADVAGNDYAHTGIGGVELTPAQTADNINEEQTLNKGEFEQESFFGRLFDTGSQYSLVSRAALAMPSLDSFGSLMQSGLSSIINPFADIAGSFSLLSDTASAAATPQGDPFGIPQYGYPQGTVPTDPETYWDQNCGTGSTMTTDYDNAAAAGTDPYTAQDGQPGLPGQNVANNSSTDGTDPCLLIQAAVGSGGGIFDQSLLSPDDLSNSTGPATGNDTGPSAAAANANYYQIGDSLTVGMAGAGLPADLQASGWTIATGAIDGSVGRTAEQAPATITADSAQIGNAGDIVVELGTNDENETEPQFAQEISTIIGDIRTINTTAKIYWVTIYSSLDPNYVNVNDAINDLSSGLNYNVIDWAGEVTSNPGMYTFDTALGVHPQGNGYQEMATWIASQIGAAPTQTALNGQGNAVTDALNTQSNEPEVISDIAHLLGAVGRALTFPLKHIDDIMWSDRWML